MLILFLVAIMVGIKESAMAKLSAVDDSYAKGKISQRGAKRQSLTKTLKLIEENPPTEEESLCFYVQKLSDLKTSLLFLDNEIENHILATGKFSDDEYCILSEICEDYMDKLNFSSNSLNLKLKSVQNAASSNDLPLPSERRNESIWPKMKVPYVDFPTFDSKPEEYERFISNFEAMIGEFQFTQFEKFSYLKKQVKGNAKSMVESVPATGQCYDAAKALLERAFCKKTVQQFSVIERISKLKLVSTKNYYQWISEVQSLSDQVNRLEITEKTFFQYFIWSGMSKLFKDEFVAVTNMPKPDLDTILENAFEVYEIISDGEVKNFNLNSPSSISSENKYDKAVTLATDAVRVNYRDGCWLCQSDGEKDSNSHKFSNCPKYDTPQSKLDRISEEGGCTRCGLLNHKVSACQYKFKGKCKKCSKFHSFYLCVHENQNSKVKEKHSNVVEYSVMSTDSLSDDIIIPSFTLDLPKLHKGKLSTRVMYDPASQMTFVSQKVLDKIKHKTIQKNVQIKVSGFNESRIMDTKIVSISCSILGENVKFNATVVPEIRTKIQSKSFKNIKNAFKTNNLVLADRCLGDAGFVGILLGVENAHVLPIVSCVLGDNSMVYYSKIGFLLAGDISVLGKNLASISSLKTTSEKCKNMFSD